MKQSISVFCRIKPVDKRKEGNYEISTWEENEKKEKLEIQIPRLDEQGVVNNKQGELKGWLETLHHLVNLPWSEALGLWLPHIRVQSSTIQRV